VSAELGTGSELGNFQEQVIMPGEFFLEFTSATPFQTIDGVANAIWTYSLQWPQSTTFRALLHAQATKLQNARIGLEFSQRLNIQDPTKFPDQPQIQGTLIEKPPHGDVQYVYREFHASPAAPIVFSFVAPSQQDTFCPVKLVGKESTAVQWVDLSFKSSTDGVVAFQQIMVGPAIVCPPPAQTPDSAPFDTAQHVEKATLVPLRVDDSNLLTRDIGVIVKAGYVRQLSLRKGEVQAIQDRVIVIPDSQSKSPDLLSASGLWSLLKSFEGSPMQSQLPHPGVFASIPVEALSKFGAALQEFRKQAVDQISNYQPAARLVTPAQPNALAAPSSDLGTKRLRLAAPVGRLTC
jgi:hypothetical protein